MTANHLTVAVAQHTYSFHQCDDLWIVARDQCNQPVDSGCHTHRLTDAGWTDNNDVAPVAMFNTLDDAVKSVRVRDQLPYDFTVRVQASVLANDARFVSWHRGFAIMRLDDGTGFEWMRPGDRPSICRQANTAWSCIVHIDEMLSP